MNPPKKALAFLRWFCREDYIDEIEGDLIEVFRRQYESNPRKAKWKFALSVIRYFRPDFIKSFKTSYQPDSYSMYKNYFKLAYRNLISNRGFSIINIMGLSIGMTCCLLIFQFVAFEYSYDRFHTEKENVYRLLQAYGQKGQTMDQGHAYTAQALAPALKEGIPEIVAITRVSSDDAVLFDAKHPENVFEDDGLLYVDKDFLDMFTFPIVSGDFSKVLQPGTVLISESAARKYFKTDNPVGEVLDITGNLEKSFTVTGVFKDVPSNSHMQFDVLLPIEDLLRESDYATEPEGGWSWNNFTTFIQIQPGANRADVEKKMTDIYLRHRGEMLAQQGGIGAINAQPLLDIHLNAEISAAGNIVTGSYKTVYFFLVVGFITLIIALVNYINLATSRAINRSREVGVRKAVGAKRGQLVAQFLSESALTNLVSAALALVSAALLMPLVNEMIETQLSMDMWMNPSFWIAFSLTILVSTLLAGTYPAFVLSSFRPATVLKGRTAYVGSHLWLRRSLVVIQFVASIVLVAGTATVFNQLNFMRDMDLGLNLEKVVTIRAARVLPENTNRAQVTETFIQQINAIPGVLKAARSSTVPGSGFNWNGAAIRKSTDDPSAAIRGVATYIDSTFTKVYGLTPVAGKEFKDVPWTNDPEAPWNVMVNETTVKSMGYASSADAVDQLVFIGDYRAQIVGVYKDFNWSSAHEARQNIVFGYTSTGRYVSVKLTAANAADVISKIKTLYEAQFPGNIFQYAFADESFDQQYKNDQRFAKLFSVASGMATFIACLGLLGLVAFTAQQRTKEIGMRKVLGASAADIVTLLSKDFLKLIVIGFILAVPITWYTMNQWLDNFAYREEVNLWVLALAGGLAMLIAMITVSWQSLKAALANPVNSLRSE
jgi:putative ABC transport system permease protein